MALVDEYKKGDVTKAIVDVLNSGWSDVLKRHILTKELLWHIDFPRAVSGSIVIEPPNFSLNAKRAWEANVVNDIDGRKGLILEHAIPRSTLYEMLIQLKEPTYESVRSFQRKYVVRAFVTKEEDERLDALGLRKSMPEGWLREDVWARHHAAKIKHSKTWPKDLERKINGG